MKFHTKKSTLQKIIAVMIIIIIASFTLSPYSVFADGDEDDDGWSIPGTLAKEFMGLFTWVCDILMGGLNNFMLGANGFGSAMLAKDDPNLTDEGSWLYAEYSTEDDDRTIRFENGEIDTSIVKWGDAKYSIPNMLYSPENIFANNIAVLDINFLKDNKFDSIYVKGNTKFEENAEDKSKSGVSELRGTIASWYKSFRNIAVVRTVICINLLRNPYFNRFNSRRQSKIQTNPNRLGYSTMFSIFYPLYHVSRLNANRQMYRTIFDKCK